MLNVDSRIFALPEHYFDPAAPIAFDQASRSWPVSAYDDVLRLFTDRESFTAAVPAQPPLTLDSAALKRLEPPLHEHTAQVLRALPAGEVDLAPVAGRLAGHAAAMVAPEAADPDTAAAAIGDALLLLTYHGHLEAAAADQHRLAHAIDEVLRWSPPTPVITRTVLQDTTFGEIAVPAGATVAGRVTAANRDPKRFPGPATFDITRHPNQHLSFGRGAYYHPGAAVIRMQTAVVVHQAARLLPGLRWNTSQPVRRHPGPVHYPTRVIFTVPPSRT